MSKKLINDSMNLRNQNILLILVVLLLVLLVVYNKKQKNNEQFRLFYESSPSTRNMSYDLRCEPVISKKNYYFKQSSIEPHYRRKCLELR